MPLLLAMSLFGGIGTLLYIPLSLLLKRRFSIQWRRAYLICNILEYLIPFPYFSIKYKKLLNFVFGESFLKKLAKSPLYMDITADTIQISTNRIYFRDCMVYIMAGIIIVGLALFAYYMYQYHKVKQILRSGADDITDRERSQLIQDCVSQHRTIIARHIRIYQCKALGTPLTIGILNPIIILPCMECTRQELSLAIEHEMTHIRHLDNFIKMLGLVVIALNFFNPLAYYLLYQWNAVAELSCDSTVIMGKTSEEVKLYGLLVIRMAEKRKGNRALPVSGLNLQNKQMKERIY